MPHLQNATAQQKQMRPFQTQGPPILCARPATKWFESRDWIAIVISDSESDSPISGNLSFCGHPKKSHP